MKKVYGLDEAMEFFLSNSSGSCICVNSDSKEKVVYCYPEAKEFFNNTYNGSSVSKRKGGCIMSNRNYEEDYILENGNYLHTCPVCKNIFRGHKGRNVCKKCLAEPKFITCNQIWEPTMELGYKFVHNENCSEEVLMQKWKDNTGDSEWREISKIEN